MTLLWLPPLSRDITGGCGGWYLEETSSEYPCECVCVCVCVCVFKSSSVHVHEHELALRNRVWLVLTNYTRVTVATGVEWLKTIELSTTHQVSCSSHP